MALILHNVTDNVQPRQIVFSKEYEQRTLSEDKEILERIIAAYHNGIAAALPEERQRMYGTLWGHAGVGQKQGELLQALEQKSPSRLHEVLRQFFVADAAHGIALGKDEAEGLLSQPLARRHQGLVWLDRLVGFAFATGALPLPNIEDNEEGWRRCLEVVPEEVAAAIEKSIGIKLEFPEVAGVFGGELFGCPFPSISFTHLLVALDVRALAPSEKPLVLEIGGGFGGLAYYVHKLMACCYTIYDLPYTAALQAYFLYRALPDRSLRLFGEAAAGIPDITLLPGWCLINEPPSHADLVVNQDSIVEMPRATARAYLGKMRTFLRGPFLSVNHESLALHPDRWDRTSVGTLMKDVGGYVRFSRTLFPLRSGYAQEVYYPTDIDASPGAVVAAIASRLRRAHHRLSRSRAGVWNRWRSPR